MKLVLTGRQVAVTPTLRRLVDRRVARLARLLPDAIVSAQVVLSVERHQHVADITMHMRGDHILSGRAGATTWSAAVAAAAGKIEQQGQRVRGKWIADRRRHGPARVPTPGREPATPDDTTRPRIVRAGRYRVKPMSVEDAVAEVEAAAEPFVVFRNAATGAVNVLYRRRAGGFGLIEPER